jgi:hypothetical protein
MLLCLPCRLSRAQAGEAPALPVVQPRRVSHFSADRVMGPAAAGHQVAYADAHGSVHRPIRRAAQHSSRTLGGVPPPPEVLLPKWREGHHTCQPADRRLYAPTRRLPHPARLPTAIKQAEVPDSSVLLSAAASDPETPSSAYSDTSPHSSGGQLLHGQGRYDGDPRTFWSAAACCSRSHMRCAVLGYLDRRRSG